MLTWCSVGVVGYNEILNISASVAVVEAQLGVAFEKPVFVSSQGGDIATYPPSHVNDHTIATLFYTENIPWSFVAVDLEDSYEINRMELKVNSALSKLK